MTGFFLICLVTVLYCMIAHRLSSSVITAPMLFIALGVALSIGGLVPIETSEMLLHPVAEVALVVLLFLDAAQTDLVALRKKHVWPTRMLLIGLPLSIALGTLAGMVLFPDWPLGAVALIASILAATDAALGQAVVTNPNVPMRPRRALAVEMVPDGGEWLVFGAKQIVLGPLVGVAVGAFGGWILLRAKAMNLTSDLYEGALALAGLAYLGATLVGGNGFISAFVAGLAFGGLIKGTCKFVFEFTEGEGQLLAWAAFLLLGALWYQKRLRT